MLKISLPWLVMFCVLFCCESHRVFAADNMIGRQSQNEGVHVLPASGPVTIDGKLGDWDWSGRIEVFADDALRGRYSVQMAAMWDADYLYLAAKWSDPTPMFSRIDPQFNPGLGWKSDAWQMRFATDQKVHLTAWYYTPRQEPCLSLSYRNDGGQPRQLKQTGDQFESDIQLAFVMDADQQGYVEELRIPWRFLFQHVPDIQAGLVLRMGNEFLWGDVSGKIWPMHRYADNMQPGVTSREFYWSNDKAWGNLRLLDHGQIKPRRYVMADSQPKGSIPVRAKVPGDAARFTIVIEDAQGKRVRNLAGDFHVQDYTISQQDDHRIVQVQWDGKDDQGKLVPVGRYLVRGLTHKGLGAEYELCYDNPGSPPWTTADGTGGWGGDHCPPERVAIAGDWVILSWDVAEGGSGILGMGPDGLKKWGEKRGAHLLAANARFVYGIMEHHGEPQKLCRYAVTDGAYRPFVIDGKKQPIELKLSTLLPTASSKVLAITASDSTLLLATDAGELLVYDAQQLSIKKRYPVGNVRDMDINQQGICLANIDGKVVRIDLANGDVTPCYLPGVNQPGVVAWDHDGNQLVFDEDSKSLQIKAFSIDGTLVYTCGKPGGRLLRGVYDKQGLRAVNSMKVDWQGNIWTVEKGQSPRRVAVWGRDGKLVRDMIGNTGYAGTGSYLDENDPGSAYIGPLRFTLDRQQRTAVLSEILWVPQPQKSEAFSLWSHPHHFSNPGFVHSRISGQEQTYLYHNGMYGRYHAIHMKRNGCWQPVAAICYVAKLKEQLPELPLADAPKNTVVIWNDQNRDGAVQYDECQQLDEPINLDAGWTHTLSSDLSVLTNGLTRFKPIGYTDDGAPIYGRAGVTRYDRKQRGHFAPVFKDNLLLVAGTNNYPNASEILGLDMDTAQVRWSYPNPFPGVHGSHNAPMPHPGLIIGALKICGVAEVSEQVGKVFMMRGNLGQDFYMTADGLFVGAMFRDGRLPGPTLPQKEQQLPGQPIDAMSLGSEPFSGWFGRQSDGAYRMLCGLPRESAMLCRITGLDGIRRFEARSIELDTPTLAQARQFNVQQAADSNQARIYRVHQAPSNLMSDLNAWQDLPQMHISREGSIEKANVKMAYDQSRLYLQFDVTDVSPWKNRGKDYTRLFKTGDCVELFLSAVNSQSHDQPVAGDQRILIAPYENQPAAVLMQVKPYGLLKGQAVTYRTGWSRTLENVALIDQAQIKLTRQTNGYTVTASLPLRDLGLDNLQGKTLRGDVGMIGSDKLGTINVSRTCWSNEQTNLVNDEPLEAWLYPANWGTFHFE